MARGQRDELIAPTNEERIGADEKRAGPLAGQASRRPRRYRFRCRRFRTWSCTPDARAAACTSLAASSAIPDCSGSRARAMTRRCGHQLVQQFQPLRHQLGREDVTPVTLPPGRLRLATRPSSTGSPPTMKTIGIVAVAALGRQRRGSAARDDHGDLAADQIGRQRRQPIVSDPPPSGIRSRRSAPST